MLACHHTGYDRLGTHIIRNKCITNETYEQKKAENQEKQKKETDCSWVVSYAV